jgi:uncharacterized membrane protein
MLTFQLKREWLAVASLAGMVLLSLVLYPALPEQMPIHWNIQGEADGFAPKATALISMPLVALALYGFLYVAPLLDPKRTSLERSAETYILIRSITMLFFLFMHGLTLYSTFQPNQQLASGGLTLGMGLLFVVLGNYMPRMKPSWIAGIRTPWTMSSDTMWTKTHRLGGRTFVVGGLVVCLALFLPTVAGAVVMIAALVVAAGIPIVYSYLLWRRENIPS